MPDSQDPKQVNNDLPNSQFAGGLINAESVNAGRIGGDIYNTSNIHITNYSYREDIRVAAVQPVSNAFSDEKLPCPYRGLYHFSPDDAEYFFGREVFIEELFKATQTRNFIPVLGASGSGKSSVVLAGLVPKLQQQGRWLFTHFRPSDEPFYTLAQALVPLYEPEKNATEQMYQARQLAEYFIQGSVPLRDVFHQIQRKYANHRVLLIADQFEELYTLCSNEAIRRNFLDTLLAGFQSESNHSPLPPVLVSTMRADFLGNALGYPPFADILRNADIKVRSMNRSELSEVIVKPAQKLGVTFQDGLIERILDDVEDEPGNLPSLEFALTLLWEKRTLQQLTHAAYKEIGELQGALASHANTIYKKLNTTEQKQVSRIFIQLVRPGEGTEDTRRLAMKAELGEENWTLVQYLADKRLVVTSLSVDGQQTVEVAHEALIRKWDKLSTWIESDRAFRTWQEQLRGLIRQWEISRNDEGALLRGVALAKAEEWLQQRLHDISSPEWEFIQMSLALRDRLIKQEEVRRKRRNLVITISTIVLAVIGGFTWQQYQKAEINIILALAADGIATPELFSAANYVLQEANKLSQSEKELDIARALSNYRAVIKLTELVEKQVRQNPQDFPITDPDNVSSIFKQAEAGLVKLISNKRLPILEQQLKRKEIGIKDWNIRTMFEKQYTNGALKTTYKILRSEYGAKADIYNSGQISTEQEANRMPCQTLIEIEKIWQENTGCSWFQSCTAIMDGENLFQKIFNFPRDAAKDRLSKCGIKVE